MIDSSDIPEVFEYRCGLFAAILIAHQSGHKMRMEQLVNQKVEFEEAIERSYLYHKGRD